MIRIFILFSLVLSACSTTHSTARTNEPANETAKVAGVQSSNFLGYQPIAPLPALKVSYYNDETDAYEEKYWASFTSGEGEKDQREKKKSLLSLQSSYTYIAKNDISGGISFLSNGASAEKGDYIVTSDYILYRVENIEGAGIGLVGVGMRVRAKIRTTKKNLNISGFFNIAVEAKAGNLSGELQVDVIGLYSKEIIQIFPAMTTEINQTSIQNVMQALASIKAKVSEDDVDITPHLLALQQSEAEMKDEIIKSIAYGKGLEAGKKESGKIQEIIQYIGGSEKKWKALVDSSELNEQNKKKWMAYDVGKIGAKLKHELGKDKESSDIFNKLFDAYKKR